MRIYTPYIWNATYPSLILTRLISSADLSVRVWWVEHYTSIIIFSLQVKLNQSDHIVQLLCQISASTVTLFF